MKKKADSKADKRIQRALSIMRHMLADRIKEHERLSTGNWNHWLRSEMRAQIFAFEFAIQLLTEDFKE